MTTFNDVVEETLAYLRGFVRDQEMSTYLTAEAAADDLALSVKDVSLLSRGRVEIGDELVYVETVDRQTNTAVVPPYGRGMDASTAAIHAVGSRVTVNPIFPRARVKDAINDTVRSMDGDLFGVSSASFTFNGSQATYPLPADVQDVVSVQYDAPWSDPEWFECRRWTFNRVADSTAFPTGKSITISDSIVPGQTVRVTYTSPLVPFTSDSDEFTSSGLRESAKDCVVLGATNRLVITSEAFRLNTRAVEPNQLDLRTQPGQPSNLSKYVYQLFRQRVGEERTKLLNDYPIRVHVTAR